MLNKVHVRAIAAALWVLTATPTPSSAQDDGSDESRQINPAMTLASLFPEAEQIGLAVAVVPDPLVPRYRRLYDLELVAIELGMLKKGYVLDRFYLPWNEKLRATGADKQKADMKTRSQPIHPTPAAKLWTFHSPEEPTGFCYFAAIPGATCWMSTSPTKLRPGKVSAAGHPPQTRLRARATAPDFKHCS